MASGESDDAIMLRTQEVVRKISEYKKAAQHLKSMLGKASKAKAAVGPGDTGSSANPPA